MFSTCLVKGFYKQELQLAGRKSEKTEMADDRDYDIVVFGASGYTGQYVNEELYRLQKEEGRTFKWAAAGRSQSKLEAFLKASKIEGIDTIVADVKDQGSLEAMCSKATVLINCVGPYLLYGEPVIKACISQKTNYVDITGESYFMETMFARYDADARSAGIYIVSCCGFDCIPNDLGALLLQRTFNGDLAYVESYMSVNNGGRFNTGTWESFLHSIVNHRKLSNFRREQNLTPLPMPAAKPPKRKVADRWCLQSQAPDKDVVYRSMRYRKENAGVEPYKFLIYFGLGSFWQAIGVMFGFLMLFPFLITKCGFRLLVKYPEFFSFGVATSSGPTRKELEKTTFSVVLQGTGHAEGDDKSKPPNSKITVKVWGIDPGYGATSALLVQSALCFIDEKDKLPTTGGIYTPAVAFGDTKLIQNLENTGKVKFTVLPGA